MSSANSIQHSIDFKPYKFKHVIYPIFSWSNSGSNVLLSLLSGQMDGNRLAGFCIVQDNSTIRIWNCSSKSGRGRTKMDPLFAYSLELSVTRWFHCRISWPQSTSLCSSTTSPQGKMHKASVLRHLGHIKSHREGILSDKVAVGPMEATSFHLDTDWYKELGNMTFCCRIRGVWECNFLLSSVQHKLDFILIEGFKKKRIILNILFLTGLYRSFHKHTPPTQGISWALVASICLSMYFWASLPYYLSLYPLLSDNELTLVDCMPMRTSSHLSANRQLCSISITCHYDAATVLQPFPVLWSAKINYPRLNY